MTPDEIANLRINFLEFVRYMFKARRKSDMMVAPFHEEISDTLRDVVLGDITRLVINISPRAGKTDIVVKYFMAWCMGNWPHSQFIHASYSKTLATANTSEIREIMSHEAYQAVFGPTQFRNDTNAKDHFKTKQGGHVYATGAEGTITGFGAGHMGPGFGGAIIVDDPHKAGEANSDTMRKNVLDWYNVTLDSRRNSRDTPVIIIMQRLHEEDLSGFLLGGGSGEKWHHLNIPAIGTDGKSFWPDNSNFTIEELRRKEQANSYVFAGQYMQRPAPLGGGIFKDDWWNFYDELPEFEWRGIYADTAQKTKEENDYTVFQCWGRTKSGDRYLIDQLRGKWEAPDLLDKGRQFWSKHKQSGTGRLRFMKVEDKVSGTGLIQTLKREGIQILPIKRNIDKVTRAFDAAPIVETGQVYLPRREPWINDFLIEASYFPNGKHDDQLDPMMDAVTDTQAPVSYAWV